MANEGHEPPAFDVKLAEYRIGRDQQGAEYSRLRWAYQNGLIQYAKVNGQVWLNRKQADEHLSSYGVRESCRSTLQSAADFGAGDLHRLIAAVQELTVAIRQATQR